MIASIDKIRWQCRRGVKELDVLLQNYLETDYLQADDEEKKQFAELLKWEDDELQDILLGGKKPAAKEFDILVDKIRSIT